MGLKSLVTAYLDLLSIINWLYCPNFNHTNLHNLSVLFILFAASILTGDAYSQLYQGPAAGSITGGVVVSTDNFTDDNGFYGNAPFIVKGLQNQNSLPESINLQGNIPPTGPEGSNVVIDRTDAGLESPSLMMRNFPGVPRTSFIPPDPSVAAGPTHIMGGVNSTFRIWDKQGNVIKTISASTWLASLGLGIGGTVSDPKIVYDHFAKRWIMSWITPPIGPLAFDVISVSDDSIPLGTWYNFAMRTDLNGNTPVDLWRDYQGMGYDANALYITGNGFTISGSSFRYSTIRIFNKSQLYANNAGPVSWFDMWDIRDAGNQGVNFGIRPSIVYGNPSEYYLLCNSNSGGTYVSLYKLVNPLNNPSMTGVAVPVVQYSSPPASGQLGTQSTITSGGTSSFRNEPVFRNGFLHAVHAVRFESAYSAFKYYKLNVSSNTATQDITFGAPNFYYSYPAVSVDKHENVIVSFSRSATTEYIGAGYTTRTATDPQNYFNPSSLLQAGRGTYINSGSSNRWGDYMGSWTDPSNDEDFWIMTEFADLQNAWGTWVGNVRVTPFQTARLFSSRDTLQFGNIEAGTVSDTQKIVLRNYGSTALTITALQSSNSDFRIVSSPQLPLNIPFNDSTEIKISFSPASFGFRKDSLRIASTDAATPNFYIGLKGKGYVINPVQANEIYAVTGAQSNGSLLRISSTGGAATLIGPTGFTQLNGLSIRPSNNKLYAVLSASPSTLLYRVNASEGDAYPTTPIPLPNIRGIAFDINDELYCSSIDGRLFRYNLTSGDTSFIGNTGIASLFGLSVNPLNRSLWGISSVGGVYRIDKNSAASQLVGNTGNVPNSDIAFSKTGVLYGISGLAATINKLLQLDTTTGNGIPIGTNTGFAGINGIAISPEVVGISQLTGTVPDSYSLKQNYPNPFNPSTRIEYDLKIAGPVSLEVYDATGRIVKQLVNQYQSPGSYRYEFDGNGLASGVYFYTLRSGNYSAVKRMALIK